MEELDMTPIESDETKRPQYLKVLCILSFISIGLSILGGIYSFTSGPKSHDEILMDRVKMLEENEGFRAEGMDGLADLTEQMQRMNESLNENFYPAMVVSMLVVLIGLLGVIWMWNGKRLGFHVYIIYSLLSIAQLYMFVSPSDIPTVAVVMNVLFSGAFVLMYSRNLSWMTK